MRLFGSLGSCMLSSASALSRSHLSAAGTNPGTCVSRKVDWERDSSRTSPSPTLCTRRPSSPRPQSLPSPAVSMRFPWKWEVGLSVIEREVEEEEEAAEIGRVLRRKRPEEGGGLSQFGDGSVGFGLRREKEKPPQGKEPWKESGGRR
ncbi:hypothetical protein HID58_015460 [Brassica napus]|uniref:Uncharacterized protein n=1 Tax=Brassica napus TaxID=3708 RepID=A0ABQ8DKG5_BRANA|nr:hypothetical protein HID58_015460 [Brassica napus]